MRGRGLSEGGKGDSMVGEDEGTATPCCPRPCTDLRSVCEYTRKDIRSWAVLCGRIAQAAIYRKLVGREEGSRISPRPGWSEMPASGCQALQEEAERMQDASLTADTVT